MKRTLALIFLYTVAAGAIGCVPAGQENGSAADASAPRAADIAKDYKRLGLMTNEPASVDPVLSALCRGANPDEIEEAKKRNGPHAMAFINVYMNDLAADSFRRSRTPYPVGSTIVKEKTEEPYGVGGMIKRAPGYDPKNGDWEYFYAEGNSAIESGRIASCVGCHRRASSKDYIFADWASHASPPPGPSR